MRTAVAGFAPVAAAARRQEQLGDAGRRGGLRGGERRASRACSQPQAGQGRLAALRPSSAAAELCLFRSEEVGSWTDKRQHCEPPVAAPAALPRACQQRQQEQRGGTRWQCRHGDSQGSGGHCRRAKEVAPVRANLPWCRSRAWGLLRALGAACRLPGSAWRPQVAESACQPTHSPQYKRSLRGVVRESGEAASWHAMREHESPPAGATAWGSGFGAPPAAARSAGILPNRTPSRCSAPGAWSVRTLQQPDTSLKVAAAARSQQNA